ncbi:hypothetical protein I4F81_002595 [Pyropia yezoensis]|uniref:Uncharacterized protein n=1 Tax=Pyropia yezoensis TaxID=2788 RepID=A0ACC3BQ04_PYRYE|nr:hypothetical protein I4F81_002595 [Neopyropia yezoensis]
MDFPANATAAGAALTTVLDSANLLAATLPPSTPPPAFPSAPVVLDSLASLHAFYMRAHSAPVNWAIHAAAVPVLKVSILLLLAVATARLRPSTAKVTPTTAPPSPSCRLVSLFSTDAGLAIAVAYVAYYAALSPAVGGFAAAVFGAEWLAARLVLAAAGRRGGVAVGVLGVAATQVAMVAGHRVWEGAPQAIVAGPVAALAAAPLCMQLDVAVRVGWLPRMAAALAAAA